MQNIFQKNFDQITSSDITDLIKNKYDERQSIEYKKEMYGRSDSDKRELLRDVSSIANAFGGYLIIGLDTDKDSVPVGTVSIPDAEVECHRIEQVCLASIEPRIPGLRMRVIRLDSGEDIIIIIIPRSIKKPHMVLSGLNQFWMRHNKTKSPMSVDEIRDAFVNIERLQENIKQYLVLREREISEIIGDSPFLVMGGSPLIITEDRIDISEPKLNRFLISPPNQTRTPRTLSFELFGSPEAYPEPTLGGLIISYPGWITVEVSRSGYYEVRIPADLFSYPRGEKKYINYEQITSFVVNYFRALAYLTELLGIEETIVAYVSLLNIKGIILEYAKKPRGEDSSPRNVAFAWDRKDLKIPPIQISSFSNYDKIAKLFLDKLWNAFGFEKAPYFKDDKYIADSKTKF